MKTCKRISILLAIIMILSAVLASCGRVPNEEQTKETESTFETTNVPEEITTQNIDTTDAPETDAPETTAPVEDGLTGAQVAAIVLVSVAVLAGGAVGVLYFLKKKNILR